MNDLRAEDVMRAADTCNRLARDKADVALMGEVLTKIGSIINSTQEAEDRAAKANAKADELTASLAGLQADIDIRLAAAQELAQKIIAGADSTKVGLMAGAEKITATARETAKAITEKANREAQETVDAAMNRKRDIDALADQRKQDAADVQLRLDAARSELAGIEERLAKAKQAYREALA